MNAATGIACSPAAVFAFCWEVTKPGPLRPSAEMR